MRSVPRIGEVGARKPRRGANPTQHLIRFLAALGPGHRWPYLLSPLFWFFALIPSTRDGARRLQPVTLEQTIHALVNSVEHPCAGIRILEAAAIRLQH